MRFALLLLCPGALLWSADAASGQGLTARELFYTPPPAKTTQVTRTTTPTTTGPRRSPRVSSTTTSAQTTKNPKSEPGETAEASIPPTTLPATTPEGPDPAQAGASSVVPVVASSGVPLAMRYSILKQDNQGNYPEVDTDSVFHSGDRIKLQIKTNDRAYLYVASLGSSNNWTVLFPNPQIDGGNNIVERDRVYEIPGGDDRFTFDEQRGKERLVLMLSRQPIQNVDQLIYKMDQSQPNAAPARTMMARSTTPIPSDVLDKVRAGFSSRDLVFEKVNDEKKPAKREKYVPTVLEKAAYVASSKTDDSARLVADVTLAHD